MQESPVYAGGAASAVQESPVHAGEAVGHSEPGPLRNEKDRKRLEKNGGIRPGKRWPQYLAATLGTWLIPCLMSRVPDGVQIYRGPIECSYNFSFLAIILFLYLSLYSLPLRNKIGA